MSARVATQLASYTTGTVSRLAGANRYETAALVSAALTQGGAPIEGFIVTGLKFPDALAIGSVAGAAGSPILLTDPSKLSAATANELQRLGLGRLTVVGGNPSVAPAVLSGVARLWR